MAAAGRRGGVRARAGRLAGRARGAARDDRAARARCTSTRARTVHTVGMRFPIDVAFLSTDLTVVRLARLKPWRMAWAGATARSVVETEAGSFERWGVRVGDQLEVREVPTVRTVPQAARRDRGAAGPARAGGHADREPGRSVAPGARRAGDGGPDLLRGHPPHPGPAVRRWHLGQGPDGDRLLSLHGHNEAARVDRVVARGGGRGDGGRGQRRRARPGSRTRGPGWRPQVAAAGETVSTVPGPVVGPRRAGGERAADRPLLRRGLPAPQGARTPAPDRRAHGASAHHGGARGAGPGGGDAGRAGGRRSGRGRPPSCPRAHQGARGGLARDAGRGRRASSPRARCAARWSWCSGARRRRTRPATMPSRVRSGAALGDDPSAGPRQAAELVAAVARRARADGPTRPRCASAGSRAAGGGHVGPR